MIRKTQWKFWGISMAAASFCVILLIAVINIMNTLRTDRMMKNALNEMSATARFWGDLDTSDELGDAEKIPNGDGRLPGSISGKPWWAPGKNPEDIPDHEDAFFPEDYDEDRDIRKSAMGRYSGRLCVVCYDEDDNEVEDVLMSEDNALTEEEAVAIAEKIRKTGKTEGKLDDYYYKVETLRVFFMDGSAEKDIKQEVLKISSLAGLGGLILMGFFVYLMSKKAMEPLKESTEKQKRFITDAGHELKTPLSVISTNMDILEQDVGKNEWIDGTRKQVGRLRKLVTSLVSLSKLEETQEETKLESVNVSEIAEDCVDAFTGAAEMAGKELHTEIEPGLFVKADLMKLSQLLTILCDNAVKYATGDITVRLYQKKQKPGEHILFETENDWDHALPPEELSKLFDRFYRADESRSKKDGKEGYGLGLSIAKAIADQMKASLNVEETKEGKIKFSLNMKA